MSEPIIETSPKVADEVKFTTCYMSAGWWWSDDCSSLRPSIP
jgi:hypothetical protein